jgi:cobalt-zinc-cadmium efflux system membrane fusion protein
MSPEFTLAELRGVVVIAALIATGCGDGEPPVSPKEEANQPEADVNSITPKPEMMQRVKTGRPELIDIADKLQVPSQIQVNEHGLLSHISTYMTGRIIEVHAMLGDRVEAGAVLARISSPEFTQAQLAYLSAFSQTILAEKAAERARNLLNADVIAVAEVERRESELQILRAELEAARDHLRLLGVNSTVLKELVKHGRILPSVAITASQGGTVIARNIIAGQVVEPADQLFKIADLSAVWAVGNVPEQIARIVQVGQNVEVHVPALGNASLNGRIVFVADLVNPLTRTVEVKTEVDNPQRRLKPSMLATMHVIVNRHKSLAVPEGAVVREAERDYVFIVQGNNQFKRMPVELGAEIGAMRPVLKGLVIDQGIVVDGAFDLDNERKLAELE